MKYRYIMVVTQSSKFGEALGSYTVVSFKPIILSEIEGFLRYLDRKESATVIVTHDLVSISLIEKGEEIRSDNEYGEYNLEEILKDGE